jgi:hypothetical protein
MDAAGCVAIRFEIVTAAHITIKPITAVLTNVVMDTPVVRVAKLTGTHAAVMFHTEQA